MATGLVWARQPGDTYGVLGLALNACDERDAAHGETLERIREILLLARQIWEALGSVPDEDRMATVRTTFRLLLLANTLAVTDA
jgi:hypothetical protein